MTKECVAIKTGMLLKYADEPSWVIVSNDSKWTLGKLKKCLFNRATKCFKKWNYAGLKAIRFQMYLFLVRKMFRVTNTYVTIHFGLNHTDSMEIIRITK